MNNKICCIFNLAPHYRAPIYKLMDKELPADFFFGDKVNTPIKLMNVTDLRGYKKTVKNIRLFNTAFIWQAGTWKLVFRPYEYFIVTGSPYILSNFVIALLARLLNKKVLAWSHGMKEYAGIKKRLREKLYFKLCSHVLLYGEYSKDYMMAQGFKESKLIPIYNSLDHDTQLKVRNSLQPSPIYQEHFSNNDPTLIYIGRLQHWKKLDLLVEAHLRLTQQGQACNLVFIGKDVDGTQLEDLVRINGLSKKVWFYGPSYDEEEIGKLIFNADLCISPGPVGLTALHALTYGTPVITNNDFSRQMPEFEVIKRNVTGDYFSDGDVIDLTNTIGNWLKNNSGRREQIRKDAYRIIDGKYNPNYQLSVLKDIIEA